MIPFDLVGDPKNRCYGNKRRRNDLAVERVAEVPNRLCPRQPPLKRRLRVPRHVPISISVRKSRKHAIKLRFFLFQSQPPVWTPREKRTNRRTNKKEQTSEKEYCVPIHGIISEAHATKENRVKGRLHFHTSEKWMKFCKD